MIVLHIGAPKTGTTALQQFLSTNEAALRARGISYMRAGRAHIAHNPLPTAIAQNRAEGMLRAIMDEHDAAPDLLHVISSEIMFRIVVAQRLRPVLPAGMRGAVRVLCYLRRQDHYLEAIYKQRVKNGLTPPDRAAFLEAQLPKLSYGRLIEGYARLFGPEAIRLRPFDRARLAGGDIVRDFTAEIGLHDLEGLAGVGADANPSLSVELSEMLGRFAIAGSANVRALIRLISEMDDPALFASRDAFDLASRRRVVAQTAADTEAMRARYRPDLARFFDTDDLEAAQEAPARDPAAAAGRSQAAALALARALSLMQEAEPAAPAPSAAPGTAPLAAPAAPAPAPETRPAAPAALPVWFTEICPAGPRSGFFAWLGNHGTSFVDRGAEQLVVTFDNLHNVGDTRPERDAWAARFCAERGWSHLGVISQRPDWFRDAALIGWFEARAAEGFFARFGRVAFAGASMGGFGALVFSALAPGATVAAFSPQSTLARQLVRWEGRFAKGRGADWTLPHGDAAEAVGRAGRVWVVVDPFEGNDMRHAARLGQGPVTVLRAPGCGHKTALALNRMGALKEVLGGAIDGTLTPGHFARLVRGRRDLLLWVRALAARLEARGQTARAERLRRLYRARRGTSAPPPDAGIEDLQDAE